MDIRAVAFDVNGTLVRILADDDDERIFRAAAHFLTYQGIDLHRHELRELYFQLMKEQKAASPQPSSSSCRCSWPRCPAASRGGGSACTRMSARCSASCASTAGSLSSPTR